MLELAFHKIGRLAKGLNLEVIGVADLSEPRRHASALRLWQEDGFAGHMDYMRRDPELLTDARRLLPEVQSVLMFSVGYDKRTHPELPPGFGRVARYAWGRDYHRALRKRLRKLAGLLEDELGRPFAHRIFTDAVPMLERAMAASAGLGFQGKNTLLIAPGRGSYFFICELVSELRIADVPRVAVETGCRTCARCIAHCPTGAIVEPYRLDARRCISYLSIEKRGELDWWEREALGEWVFGCDLCQDICPFNHTVQKRAAAPDLAEFSPEMGAGPLLDLAGILAIANDRRFADRFAGTPLMRAGFEGLKRNALAVAANTAAEEATPAISMICDTDPSALLRRHALWALWRIRERCNNFSDLELRSRLDRALRDDDASVALEARRILEKI